MQMSSFNQSPSCLQLWARSNLLAQELPSLRMVKDSYMAHPPSPFPLPRAYDSHLCRSRMFFWGGATLSSDEYSHDRVCAHEKGINHSKVDLWQLKVWGCLKNIPSWFWLWKKTDLLSLGRLGQAMKRVQDKQCLGQVLCIRELALFLFLAADLQGFFRTCWY